MHSVRNLSDVRGRPKLSSIFAHKNSETSNNLIHTEKSFRNLIKWNRNLFVFTIFLLIWNQTDVRLVFCVTLLWYFFAWLFFVWLFCDTFLCDYFLCDTFVILFFSVCAHRNCVEKMTRLSWLLLSL